MKNLISFRHSRRSAFTLVELLVVIAIIILLVGLMMPVTKGIAARRKVKIARAELLEVQTAIEAYKAKYGAYPADNPNNSAVSPLYFELVGSVLTNSAFQTLDGRFQVAQAAVPVNLTVAGFVNSSTSLQNTDDKPAPVTFLRELKPAQFTKNSAGIPILLCSEDRPVTGPAGIVVPTLQPGQNPFYYVSSHPTNNPGSYDLWVNVYLSSSDFTPTTIGNWNEKH